MRAALATLSICLAVAGSAAAQAPGSMIVCRPATPEDVAAALPVGPDGRLDVSRVGQGSLLARSRGDATVRQFSLKHTEVTGEVSGFLAGVTVTQLFSNPYEEPLEALYVFPLPEQAAVDAMEIVVGGRVIRGVIQTREAARETYERAKAEGKTAALLDQERPNIFTQSVANILPGEDITVRIHYVERVKYEDGVYEFNFPMTVGPRYIGGAPLPTRQGEGWAPDTTEVPDASRITPPVLTPDTRPGRDISVTLELAPGLAIKDISSVSHRIEVAREGPDRALVGLAADDRIPNKTFTLSYTTGDRAIRPAFLAHRKPGESEGYFMLLLQPQLSPSQAEIVPREIYLVLDTSGSQMGLPIEKSKDIAKRVVERLMPEDTFQILSFDTNVTKFEPAAVRATPANIARALAYISTFNGGGGTDIDMATREAILPANDPARLRMVIFFTDGFIGGDDQVLSTLAENLREETRVFSVGVGNDVNRYLVSKMGEVGRGSATFVNLARDSQEVADEFERRIRGPVLTSLRFEAGGLAIDDTYPRVLGDLFEGQPAFVVGRYRGAGTGEVAFTGRVRGRPMRYAVKVTLPEVAPEHATLASLWARQKIEALTVEGYRGETPQIVDEITQTALRYSLMSKYTSFVAVEEIVRVDPGTATRTETVPVPLPEGVAWEGIFGELSRGEIPPGDPIVAVRAPAGARRVTAYFPFGLEKQLALDPVTGTWRGRFLVPTGVADGWYVLLVVAELPDGRRVASRVPYHLDSAAPEFELDLEQVALAGDEIRIAVDTVEPVKEVTVYSPIFGEEQLLLESADRIRFEGRLRVAADTPTGDYEVVVSARDAAGNRYDRTGIVSVIAASER